MLKFNFTRNLQTRLDCWTTMILECWCIYNGLLHQSHSTIKRSRLIYYNHVSSIYMYYYSYYDNTQWQQYLTIHIPIQCLQCLQQDSASFISYPAVVDNHFLIERPLTSYQEGRLNGEAYLMSFTKDEGSVHGMYTLF
jgi:hypothetical protein